MQAYAASNARDLGGTAGRVLLIAAISAAAMPGHALAQAAAGRVTPPTLALDPTQVARAAENAAAASEASADRCDDATASAACGEGDLSERIPGLVRANHASASQKVARGIEQVLWRVITPWRRSGKGSPRVRYWYIGRTIDADILEDGSVEIRAKHGITLSPVAISGTPGKALEGRANDGSPAGEKFGSPTRFGVGVSVAQPERVLDRVATGKEPPNVEARSFLHDTQRLRDLLTDNARVAALSQGDQELDATLRHEWSRATSPEARRSRMFRLWDSCADDETGERGRARIEAFLRERQTAPGECLYSSEELEALNRTRQSRQPFAPCAPGL